MTPQETLPVSVVIPAYNAAGTIERAIRSVLSQTAQPREIFVVDDGSTDATAEVASGAGASVIRQPNAGTGAARNAGIRASTASWIALLDADDEWHPTKLEEQWKAAALRRDVGIVGSDYRWVHRDGTSDPSTLSTSKGYLQTERSRIADDVVIMRRGDVAKTLVWMNFVLPSTLIIAKDVFRLGGYFRARGELISTPLCEEAEDLEWILRALRASDLLVVERCLVNYHNQVGSLSSNTGRMRYGDVKLGERVTANAAHYAPGIATLFLEARSARLRLAAREFFRAGDVGRARFVLAEAARESRLPSDVVAQALLALADNALGRFALESARAIWKTLLKPLFVRRSSEA